MSIKALHPSEMLKKVLFKSPPGMPVTSSQLGVLGISRQLAHSYTRYGWLKPLSYGYYQREGDVLTREGVVAALEANGVNIHIGGKSALALKGFSHYLNFGSETLTLYGKGIRRLPAWVHEHFPVDVTIGTLFSEGNTISDKLAVKRLDDEKNAPFVSEPERAVLELLDHVPRKQTIDEAKQLLEGLLSLRAKKMQTLLELCTKIKVKRLFWLLAEELQLPVLDRIDVAAVDFGAPGNYMLVGKENMTLRNPHG